MAKRIVAGFDPPSIRNLGFSIFSVNDKEKKIEVKKAGLIVLNKSYEEELYDYDFAVKTAYLEDFLEIFYNKNSISEIVVEQQVLGTRGNKFSSPFLIAQTNSMSVTLQRVAFKNNIGRFLIHNKTLKKIITQNANSKKDEVMDKVLEVTGLSVNLEKEGMTAKQYIAKYEHMYDAIALVLGRYMGLDYKVMSYKKEFSPTNIEI